MNVRGVLLTLTLAASVLAVVPSVHAESVGIMYLDAVGGPSASECTPEVPELAYVMTPVAPAAPGKAYLSLTAPASCVTYWDYAVTAPFSVPGDLTVTIFLGCDQPAAGVGVDPFLSSALINLYQDGTVIGNDGSEVRYNQPLVCQPGTATELTFVVPAVGTDFAAGEMFTLAFQVFAGPGEGNNAPNFHILTGTAGQLSVISGEGLPGAAAGGEAIQLSGVPNIGKGNPGTDVIFNLTVTNIGPATGYNLSAVGLPAEYKVAFAPLSGDLASNSTASSKLKVTIPAAATVGTSIPFRVNATATGGAASSIQLTLQVTKASGTTTTGPRPTGTDSSTSGDDFTDQGETSKAAPGVEFLANIAAVGLLVVALRRRVA